MSDASQRIAAVISHADDPRMLENCIRHHLRIGVDHVFVSLSENVAAAALNNHPKIRAADPRQYAPLDPLSTLSSVLQQVMDWVAPDWVLFVDSDEIWLPRNGRIGDTSGLTDSDLITAQRYNTPLLRRPDGSLIERDLDNPYDLHIVVERERIDAAYLDGDSRVPFIMGVGTPGVLVRPSMVRQAGMAGQGTKPTEQALRRTVPDDMLILPAPFTTEPRFRRKVEAIRTTLRDQGNRFGRCKAWHWQYWLSLDDAGLAAEFRRQPFRPAALPALCRQRVLSTVRDQYGHPPNDPNRLHDGGVPPALGEVIDRYVQCLSLREPPDVNHAVLPATPTTSPKSTALQYAPDRRVGSAEQCYFYHCMDIPGHGEVLGQWDLRGREAIYLGGLDWRGKTVLEIGTASGYLAFWMERQGADVTSFDLDEHQDWDMVPMAGADWQAAMAMRKGIVRQINNAWWFVGGHMNARARVIYGTVYGLDSLERTFDVVTMNSVLLHLRDPFLALTRAASRSHDRIVVTDLAERHFLPPGAAFTTTATMHFMPRKANLGPMDTWWFVTERLVEEFLRILGFSTVTITYHTQRVMPDQDWHFYTAVGQR